MSLGDWNHQAIVSWQFIFSMFDICLPIPMVCCKSGMELKELSVLHYNDLVILNLKFCHLLSLHLLKPKVQ